MPRFILMTIACTCLLTASLAANEAPAALDDQYETAAGSAISVDAPGVLENDSDADGDPLTAVLVEGPSPPAEFTLWPDGAFEYDPASGFVGTDTFTYVANDGAADSNVATVSIVVTGDPQHQVFGDEAAFLAAAEAMGLTMVSERFESDASWGDVRSPDTALSHSHLGITWTANNPTSMITTGPGGAHHGGWGFYTLPHGSFSTGQDCHLPGNCGDGWIATGDNVVVAAGGWVETNTPFASLTVFLDGDFSRPVEFQDSVLTTSHKFFGVIDPAGFHSAEFREMEGVAEDQKFIFGDDFTFGVVPSGLSLSLAGSCPGTLDLIVAGNPNAAVVIYGSRLLGSSVVPAGRPCAGTVLDLAQLRVLERLRLDANGDGSATRTVGPGQCGLWLQALAVNDCSTSPPIQIP